MRLRNSTTARLMIACVVCVLLATTLSAVAVADHTDSTSGEHTTSTGDVDTYYLGEEPSIRDPTLVRTCPTVVYSFKIKLTLTDPSAVDQVTLSAQDRTTTVADVANADDPTATVFIRGGYCKDTTIQVTGAFVDGETPYKLTTE